MALYLYYGNSTAADQQNKTGVWDSSYMAVFHLPNGSVLSVNDSTNNGNNGSGISGVSASAGTIDGAASFNGSSSQGISVGSNASLSPTAAWTLEAWFQPGSFGSYQSLVAKRNTSGNVNYFLGVTPGGAAYANFTQGTNNYKSSPGTSALSAGIWYHLVGVYNGSSIFVYLNGSVSGGSTSVSGSADTTSTSAILGNDATGDPIRSGGVLDEVRISNAARSASWVSTEYNNQSSPSTFYSVGSQSSP